MANNSNTQSLYLKIPEGIKVWSKDSNGVYNLRMRWLGEFEQSSNSPAKLIAANIYDESDGHTEYLRVLNSFGWLDIAYDLQSYIDSGAEDATKDYFISIIDQDIYDVFVEAKQDKNRRDNIRLLNLLSDE